MDKVRLEGDIIRDLNARNAKMGKSREISEGVQAITPLHVPQK